MWSKKLISGSAKQQNSETYLARFDCIFLIQMNQSNFVWFIQQLLVGI